MSLKKPMPLWSERTENTVVQHCLQYRQDQAIKKIYVLLLYVLVKVLFQVLYKYKYYTQHVQEVLSKSYMKPSAL